MSLSIRLMQADEAEAVASMVRDLARDIGALQVPKLTGAALRDSADLVEVLVAILNEELLGACLTLMTYSTWRAARGLYVVDLFVRRDARSRGAGLALLQEAGKRGRQKGASFIKLEVDHANTRAFRFYERIGFHRHDEDRLLVLEEAGLIEFLAQGRAAMT